MPPRLHLLGLPHTVTSEEFSHCAFTQKVKKFAPMMIPFGYHLTHYGVEGADSGAQVQVDVMTRAEQEAFLGHQHGDPSRFVGTDANYNTPLYLEYNRRLKHLLALRVEPGDIVLNPFGLGHAAALTDHRGINIESGIGYPESYMQFRVFESYAWMHMHQGMFKRQGTAYEWVIPNYFVEQDWPAQHQPGSYYVYFGRIDAGKGLQVIADIAKRMPDEQFLICGQGDPTPWLQSANIQYVPPLNGRARADLLGGAIALIAPTQWTEPFCGVAVEAMLCGTPAIVPTYGAPVETVIHGQTGFHCRMLNDYLLAAERAKQLDRAFVARTARARYSLEAVAPLYDQVFRQLVDLHTGGGWYTCPGEL